MARTVVVAWEPNFNRITIVSKREVLPSGAKAIYVKNDSDDNTLQYLNVIQEACKTFYDKTY